MLFFNSMLIVSLSAFIALLKSILRSIRFSKISRPQFLEDPKNLFSGKLVGKHLG